MRLVPSKYFNPEACYYYQNYDANKYRDVEASEIMDKEDERPWLGPEACQALTQGQASERIENFAPTNDLALETFAAL